MKSICFIITLIGFFQLSGQDDLMSILENENDNIEIESYSFKTTRIINLQSIKSLSTGVLDLKISHRFGFLNDGLYGLFGLDQASIRIGVDYGLTDRLTIGLGRSSFEKTYDGFFKFQLLRQQKGQHNLPLSISWFSSSAVKTVRFQGTDEGLPSSARWYYVHQLLIARKFSDRFTLQFSPTLVHRNLVNVPSESNDIWALGVGGRLKVTNRLALTGEYIPKLYGTWSSDTQPSLSLGLDIETGGHVFQLHFSNSTSIIEKGFIAESVGDWTDGGVHFGFNVSRVF